MYKFTCDKCQKGFNKRSNFNDHMNRKYSCVPQKNPAENFSQLLLTAPKSSELLPISEKTKSDEDNKVKNFSCEFCQKIFSKKGNLNRHRENICKKPVEVSAPDATSSKIIIKKPDGIKNLIEGIEVDEKTQLILSVLYKQNKELLKEMDSLKNTNTTLLNRLESLEQTTTINNTTNNLTNNTLNNIILAHGKEELNNIELDTIMKYLSTIKFSEIIPNMTKHIYLNNEKPQNKNFCVVDVARNKCKYYNGTKWITGKSSDKINMIFDNVHTALMEPFEKDNITKTIDFIKANPKKFNNKWINYSKSYLDNIYDEEEKDNREKILEELKYIFYNNKDEILKIKN